METWLRVKTTHLEIFMWSDNRLAKTCFYLRDPLTDSVIREKQN
jgi:hypothetical protein